MQGNGSVQFNLGYKRNLLVPILLRMNREGDLENTALLNQVDGLHDYIRFSGIMLGLVTRWRRGSLILIKVLADVSLVVVITT